MNACWQMRVEPTTVRIPGSSGHKFKGMIPTPRDIASKKVETYKARKINRKKGN